MSMHWNSYLVRLYPEATSMDAWQERMFRIEAITEGFIRPQAQEMALALDDSRDILHRLKLIYRHSASTDPNEIIKRVMPRIRLMAIQDQYDRVPCETPIMMWDKLSDLAGKMLSAHPTKQGIMNLRKACFNSFYGTVGMGLDRDTEGELWQTVGEIDTLLKNWDENGTDTERLLRFYPAGSNKTARFNRYAI